MTLAEWADKQPVKVSRFKETQNWTCPDVSALVDRAQAWSLTDYIVTAVSAGTIWFWPRGQRPF